MKMSTTKKNIKLKIQRFNPREKKFNNFKSC